MALPPWPSSLSGSDGGRLREIDVVWPPLVPFPYPERALLARWRTGRCRSAVGAKPFGIPPGRYPEATAWAERQAPRRRVGPWRLRPDGALPAPGGQRARLPGIAARLATKALDPRRWLVCPAYARGSCPSGIRGPSSTRRVSPITQLFSLRLSPVLRENPACLLRHERRRGLRDQHHRQDQRRPGAAAGVGEVDLVRRAGGASTGGTSTAAGLLRQQAPPTTGPKGGHDADENGPMGTRGRLPLGLIGLLRQEGFDGCPEIAGDEGLVFRRRTGATPTRF